VKAALQCYTAIRVRKRNQENTVTTAFITHERYLQHDMPNHPERADRLRSVYRHLDAAGLRSRMDEYEPEPLSEHTILLAHDARLINQLGEIEATSDSRLFMLNADTYLTPNSYTIARLAADGACAGVEAVMDEQADNALVAVRPPGHHATPTQAMGFCLLNNIAIAARHAQDKYDIERVMIVDYDVHHGNGTQDIFYSDDSVFFLSTHQSPLYPGTGLLEQVGVSSGEGYTLNVPLRAGTGDAGLRRVYEEIVWRAAERFQPELILVSAGYDGHWADPLAGLKLTLSGYDHLTRELVRMADSLCDGKIVFVMEGGYNLKVIGNGIANVARCLLGDSDIADPLGAPEGHTEPSVDHIIANVRQVHGLH